MLIPKTLFRFIASFFLLVVFFLTGVKLAFGQCTISSPTVASPVSRCGPGTITLNATPPANSTLDWYSSATGGSPISSGNSYTTPIISSATTYYVSAQASPVTYQTSYVGEYEYSTQATGGTLDAMTGATTLIGTGVDDNVSSVVTLPFTFNYHNFNYTQLIASSNGWVLFGNASSGSQFTNTTVSNTNIPKLYPFWDDLTTGTNGGVNYVVTGTPGNRIFVIQWKVNKWTFSSGVGNAINMTFQAWLYEGTNKIEFRYGSMNSPQALSFSVGLTGASNSFQSVDVPTNTASNGTAFDNNSTPPATGRLYIFNTAICRSPRVPIVVNITAPSFNVTASAPSSSVCEGASISLGATVTGSSTAPLSYTWTPGNLSGQNQTVNPTSATSYTVTVTDATGCSNTNSITINTNPRPTALSVSPSVSNVCSGAATTLVASGGQLSNQTILFEPFNSAFFTSQFTLNSVSGTFRADQNSTYYKEGNSSLLLNTTNTNANGNITTINSFDLRSYTNPVLSFYHICGLESFFGTPYDFGYVEYSTDGGTSWSAIPDSLYSGSATANTGIKNKFSSTSYSAWASQFTGSTSTPGASPATSLWRKETFSLAPYTSSQFFKLRFRMTTDVTINYFGWLIDSVRIAGTTQAPITWSPATYLNTTSGATVISSPPSGTITYTATAAASNGCLPQTATSVLTVANVVVADTITSSNSIVQNAINTANVCSQDTLRLTSIPSNSGSAPTYRWYGYKTKITAAAGTTAADTIISVSSTSRLRAGMYIRILGSSGMGDFYPYTRIKSIINSTSFISTNPPKSALSVNANLYADITMGSASGATGFNSINYSCPADSLIDGDTLRCTLLTSLVGSCIQPIGDVTSNPILVKINPTPTVSISGLTTVCNGVPTMLTANTSITSGSVSSYQWNLNGAAVGTNSSTYGATAAGNYTVTAVSNNGCSKTSLPVAITLPKYPIVASSGPNGDISPFGTDSISCGNNATYTFIPNPGYTILTVTVDGVVVSGPPTSYTFTNVTSGHTISVTFTTIVPGCDAYAAAGNDTSICAGSDVQLGAQVSGTLVSQGGVWSGGTGAFNPSASDLNAVYTPSAADIAAGSVVLTFTSNSPVDPNCPIASDKMVITIKPVPNVTTSGNLGFCTSGSTIITASATINPGSITSYQWSNSLGNAPASLPISTVGNYTITVTANNGCSTTQGVRIDSFITPTVTITGNNLICTATQTTLTANYTSSGIVPNTGYLWKRNLTTIPGQTISTYTTGLAGSYVVQVTDNYGCIGTSAPFVVKNDSTALHGLYTIDNTLPASCTNYLSIAAAVADLNARSIDGDCIFNVRDAQSEQLTSTLALGATAITYNNGAGSLNNASNTYKIKFTKTSSGSNPVLLAQTGSNTAASAAPDGIWSLRGINNVTIDGIDLTDANPAGTSFYMEYGFGLFKASPTDGAQRDTIRNCTITLNRIDTTSGSTLFFDGSVGIAVVNDTATNLTTGGIIPTNVSGTNSRNAFYGNTIQNCNIGIGLSGYAAPSPYSLSDTLNDIGGSSSTSGNTIINFGGGTQSSGSAAAYGVFAKEQWGLNVSYNSINNNNGSGINHKSAIKGIATTGGAGASITISNNTVTINGGGNAITAGIDNAIGNTIANNTIAVTNNSVSGGNSLATTAAYYAINNTAACATLNLNGNTVQNCSLTGTGEWRGIYNGGASTTVSINNNTIQNNRITSTHTPTANSFGIFNFGSGSPSPTTSLSISNNTIINNSKSGNGATTPSFYWVGFDSVRANSVALINNNTIVNDTIFYTGTATANILSAAINLGATVNKSANTISNNTIRNVCFYLNAANSNPVILAGIRSNAYGSTETMYGNKVGPLFITGSGVSTSALNEVDGLYMNSSGLNTSNVKNVYSNNIDSLYTLSTYTSKIYGINNNAGGSTMNFYKNRIHSLFPGKGGTAAKPIASAIKINGYSTSTTPTVNIFNNMIALDLTRAFSPASATVSDSTDGLRGIEILPATNGNVYLYFNSIRLAGNGASTFGSSGVYHMANATATICNLVMRNNIITNECSPGSASSNVVALRRSSSAFNNFSSKNNSFYVDTAIGTRRFLYLDGTNNISTLTLLKAFANYTTYFDSTVAVKPSFIDNVTDLHLFTDCTGSANSKLKEAGTNIVGYTTDYDGETRPGPGPGSTKPDIGADEFDALGAGLWLGVTNTDWNTGSNWCGGVPPTSATDAVIPYGCTYYPIITNTIPVCNAIRINTGGSVTINYGGKLSIYGSISNLGTFNAKEGSIEMDGSSTQTIPSGTFLNKNLKNLILNNSVTLADSVNLLGTLSFIGNNRIFNTANLLTLKSSDTLTARVADITNNGASSGNSILGYVTTERYILSRRAWRFLAMPNQHDFQTIKNAWQEGATLSSQDPKPGFGIQITSDRASWSADGFDNLSYGPAVKTYNSANNTWDGITSTNSNFEVGKGYMTFIRGDRSRSLIGQSTTPTILREKGTLSTGDVTLTGLGTGSGQYVGVGNPYPSAVDFDALTRTNLSTTYYTWDPRLGSYGAYQTFSKNIFGIRVCNTCGASGSSYTNGNYFIQSGQGFMVYTTGPSAQLKFSETNKITTTNLVSRVPIASLKMMHTYLYKIQNGNQQIFDGVLHVFDSALSNNIDENDAIKFSNNEENLSAKRQGTLLSIESMNELHANDTIFYNLSQMKTANYVLQFNFEHIQLSNLQPYLEDLFLNKTIPISYTDTTNYNFSVSNIPASFAANRFRVVFKAITPTPITYLNISATKQDKKVLVSWDVNNESNVRQYNIERSQDGRIFNIIGNVLPSGIRSYQFIDEHPLPSTNYYRVKSADYVGAGYYSNIANVIFESPSGITFYPNPVKADRILHVQFDNLPSQLYQIRITNSLGQLVLLQSVLHIGGSNQYNIQINKNLSNGSYILEILNGQNVKISQKLIL